MNEPTNDNDIDALLRMLNIGGWEDYHAALTALVAERDALRDELERERMRLAACGVAAMANTRETAANARACAPEYRSASFDDVCRIVDSEMSLRDRVAELEAQPADRDLRAEIDKLSSIVSILTCRVAALESAKFFGPHVPMNPWNPYPTTPWVIYGTRTSDRIEESA